VALAAKYQAPVATWLGTNAGMLIADAIGIVIGIVMHRHIPEKAVKWGAALVFIVFGLYGIHETVPGRILTPLVETVGLAVIAVAGYLLARGAEGEKAPEAES